MIFIAAACVMFFLLLAFLARVKLFIKYTAIFLAIAFCYGIAVSLGFISIPEVKPNKDLTTEIQDLDCKQGDCHD